MKKRTGCAGRGNVGQSERVKKRNRLCGESESVGKELKKGTG